MSLLGRATCEHALGLPEAQASLGQALEDAKKLKDKTVASRAASGLAAIALSQNTPDKEAFVSEAVELATASRSHAALGVAHFNQGRLYERKAQNTEAIEAFKHSATAYRAIDDHAGLASALARQAHLSALLQSSALETANLYQRAAHAAASARQLRQALSAFKNAAHYFERAGRAAQAALCLERAATIQAALP